MATGILGQAQVAINTNTVIYTVPANMQVVCYINVCNATAQTALVRIALTASDTPTIGAYIEYDKSLSASTAITRTGIVLNAGIKVVVFANRGVSVSVWGYEEAI